MLRQVGIHLLDQLRIVRAILVQPEDRRRPGRSGTRDGQLDPVLNRRILDLAGTPDVPFFHLVLMQRIASRDRPYERNIERDYILELIHAYDEFFFESHARNIGESVTVLSLDTNELDYVRRVEDLKLVENRIRQTLKQVPFQASLPLNDEA